MSDSFLAAAAARTADACLAKVTRRDALRKVKFGNSDMVVTECCIGTMTWGSFNDKPEQAFEQLDKAVLEMGANFLDTAELYPVAFNYGKTTEKWLGDWLVEREKQGKVKRSELYIATKCNPSGIGSQEERPDGYCHSYDADILERSCRASIERMQCEYIDLYQLHWPTRDTPIFGAATFAPCGALRPMPAKNHIPAGQPGADVFERQVLAVKSLLDKGLIKHWGLSNENAFGITMFCTTCDRLGVPRPVSCQNDFSLLNRTYESDTWEAAYRFGVVGLPYGCLAGGVLTGKYFDGSKWSKAAHADRDLSETRMRKTPDFQPRYGMPASMAATADYVKLAEAYGITPTQLALAWANQRDCNASIITGTCTLLQVEECLEAFKLELPEELMAAVDAVFEQHRNPSMFYYDKAVCMAALGWGKGRSAKEPRLS